MLLAVALLSTAAVLRSPATQPAPPKPQLRRWAVATERCVHLACCLLMVHDSLESVQADQWAAIRHSPPMQRQGRGAILKRRRRAAKVGQLIGTGYTPRITFLAGLMLRSLQMATKFRYVFDPSLGYAAGATLAARFSAREWIPCILLGWGAGGLYWSGFRVRPPGVESVPFRWH